MAPPIRLSTCDHCLAYQPKTFTTGECHYSPSSFTDQGWAPVHAEDWCMQFREGGPPMLDTLTPDTFTGGQSISVSVTGMNFTANTLLDAGGANPVVTVYVSPTQLTATAQATAPKGTHQVVAYNNVDGRASNPLPVTVK